MQRAVLAGPASATVPADSWDSFYQNWVSPTLHFGVPMLVIFVVLLVVARLSMGAFVSASALGSPPDTDRRPGLSRAGVAIGAACLAWAAFECVIGLPLAISAGHHQNRWLQLVGAVLFVLALVVAWCAFHIDTLPTWTAGDRSVVGATAGFVILVVVATTVVVPGLWASWGWTVAVAVALAVIGVVSVGRLSGLGIGMQLEGFSATGDGDKGLSSYVRTRLYALGSQPPRGIQVTQQTDVSSLPDDAVSLLPDGVLGKALKLITKVVTQPEPWRVQVTEQGDGTINVVLLRNGKLATAQVIRPVAIELPDAPAWKIELRTAAAAFVLFELSHRYPYLRSGFSGAQDWRSVAMQVIAGDRSSALTDDQRQALRTNAFAIDPTNLANRLTLATRGYRGGSAEATTQAYTDELGAIRAAADAVPGAGALRMRVLFNLAVAHFNSATLAGSRPDSPALAAARGYMEELKTLLRDFATDADLADIAAEIRGAAAWVEESIATAAQVRPATDPLLPEEPPTSALARYERACHRVQISDLTGALADLEVVRFSTSLHSWARQDPSLKPLWVSLDTDEGRIRARRFKAAFADPVPSHLLDLEPFQATRADLLARGVSSAGELVAFGSSALIAELHLSPAVARRWQRIADLLVLLERIEPKDAVPTLTLLRQVDIETTDQLRAALAGATRAAFQAKLREASADLAVLAPTKLTLSAWRAELDLPPSPT